MIDHLTTQHEIADAEALTRYHEQCRRREQAAREAAENSAPREASAPEANTNLTVQDIVVPKIPPPHPRSWQKYGETPFQFLEHMKEVCAVHMASESATQKQRRENRERAQKSHPAPGTSSKAPLVFYWQEDDNTRFRLRTSVSRNAVEELWDRYSNSQRVYDSYYNEWDVCSEFDPDVDPPGVYDDDEGLDDFYMGNTVDAPADPHSSVSIPHSSVNVKQATTSSTTPHLTGNISRK